MAGLPTVFPHVVSDTIAPSPIDPRWLEIIARKAVARDRMREIMTRFGAPGRRPTRTPRPANDDALEVAAEPTAAPSISVRVLVTKPSRRRLRQSGVRQSADAAKMRAPIEAGKSEAVKDPTPLSHPTDHPRHTDIKTQKTHAQRIPANPTHRPRAIAGWADAGELPRVIAINRALPDFGVPFAFSLNFDPKIIAAANENTRGQLDLYRRRVARVLKREIGRSVTLWIGIETDDDGRQHVHGGLAMNDDEDPTIFEKALAKSGGNWTRSGSRCADVRRQRDPDGWACYSLKRVGRTRRHLREAAGLDPKAHVQLYSVTDDLRDAGERIHAEIRAELALEGHHRPLALTATPAAPEPIAAVSESPRRSHGHPAADLPLEYVQHLEDARRREHPEGVAALHSEIDADSGEVHARATENSHKGSFGIK